MPNSNQNPAESGRIKSNSTCFRCHVNLFYDDKSDLPLFQRQQKCPSCGITYMSDKESKELHQYIKEENRRNPRADITKFTVWEYDDNGNNFKILTPSFPSIPEAKAYMNILGLSGQKYGIVEMRTLSLRRDDKEERLEMISRLKEGRKLIKAMVDSWQYVRFEDNPRISIVKYFGLEVFKFPFLKEAGQ